MSLESGTDESGEAVPMKNSREFGESREQFIALLSDDSKTICWRAAETAGRIGDPAAVEDLISTLHDDGGRMQLKAAWAIVRGPALRFPHSSNGAGGRTREFRRPSGKRPMQSISGDVGRGRSHELRTCCPTHCMVHCCDSQWHLSDTGINRTSTK